MNKSKILIVILLVALHFNFTSCDNEAIDPALLIQVPVETCAAPNGLTVSEFVGTSVNLTWSSIEGSSWEIQYGEEGFTLGTGTTVISTTDSKTINGLTITNDYDFYIRTNCDNGLSSGWIGPVGVGSTVVVCSNPTNLTAVRSATVNTQVTATWSANGDENSWELQYGPTGFALGSGTIVPSTTTNKVITGLSATAGYDFYVRSNCSATENSNWVGPVRVNGGVTTPVTYAYMNANVKGEQFNAMKPYLYTFTGANAKLTTLDNDLGRLLWIQGNSNPFSNTIDDLIEINIRIHENFWNPGTYPLTSNNTTSQPAVTVDLIDARNDTPLSTIERELPGTLTILEFNSATRRIRGTFTFTYTESNDNGETGPFSVLSGTFDYEVPAEAF